MLRSRFSIKNIFVLHALLALQAHLSSCSSQSVSNVSSLVYPKMNMKGCLPPCVFKPLGHDLKQQFHKLRSKGSLRLILFHVSYLDQHGGLLEKRNRTVGWMKTTGDPFAFLPGDVSKLSFGTMSYEEMEMPLVYKSQTCKQKKRCRDAGLFWTIMEDLSNGNGVVLYRDEYYTKRVCVLEDNDQWLDCSQPYHMSSFLHAIIFTNMAFILLCAVYLCPWVIVYVPHKRNKQSADVPLLMEMNSVNPVALSRLAGRIFTLPSLHSNRWADRFKILACFALVTPSVAYIELGLLYNKQLGFHEGSFYILAWRSNPEKSYHMPLVSEPVVSVLHSPPTWHGLLSICCYFIMALGISLLPTQAIRKIIHCPVCALRPTKEQENGYLSWEIRRHMRLHGVVIHKLSVPVKLVFNIFIKEITQPKQNSPLRFLKTMGCAMAVLPVSLILGILSFVGFFVAVIILSPLCTVMYYLLRHSWRLILGLFESREKQVNRCVLYGSLCLATVVVIFGNVGLMWILLFTFCFPSKVILFTLMGLILNADEAGPYAAFGVVLAFNIYSCYIRGIEEYRMLKSILFEVCLEEASDKNTSEKVENDLHARQIVFYNEEGVPLVSVELYWLIAHHLLPLTERIAKMALRILVMGVLTFVIFAIVMAFGELSGISSLAKSAAALLAGVLTKVEGVFTVGESGEKLDKHRLEKKVEKLVRDYRTIDLQRPRRNGAESVAHNTYQLTSSGSIFGIFDDETMVMDTQA